MKRNTHIRGKLSSTTPRSQSQCVSSIHFWRKQVQTRPRISTIWAQLGTESSAPRLSQKCTNSSVSHTKRIWAQNIAHCFLASSVTESVSQTSSSSLSTRTMRSLSAALIKRLCGTILLRIPQRSQVTESLMAAFERVDSATCLGGLEDESILGGGPTLVVRSRLLSWRISIKMLTARTENCTMLSSSSASKKALYQQA